MQTEVNTPDAARDGAAYREAVREYLVRSLADGTYFSAVAEAGGGLVAANGLVTFLKPPTILGGTGRIGYISNVYTLPEWRGQGIAGRLIELLIERARQDGVDKLILTATDLGKGVYERVGFKPPRFASYELRL
jgi:GNAT superfamily N-acetyltransferase